MKGILCFGDSITFGRGDGENDGWVGRLKKYFQKQDFYNCVFNLGFPGSTSTDLLKRFPVEAAARVKYLREKDEFIIIISIGTNDIGGDNSVEGVQTTPRRFRKNILKLIKEAKRHTNKIVFISTSPINETNSLPVSGRYGRYYNNEKQQRYNNITKECCLNHDVLFFDIFSELFKVKYQDWIDDVHPNPNGYDFMYEKIKYFLIENKLID
jgi:lysophospholipase L1-like esterase